jgi:hypothetical protein
VHGFSIVPWIWAIVIGIGIINSIRKKAAAGADPRARVAAADAQAAEAERRKQAYLAMVAEQRLAAVAAIPPPVARQTGAAARAAAPVIPAAVNRPAPPPRVEAPVAPAPPSGPEPILPHPSLVPHRTGVFAGMFESRKGILRAIVAAEVLGKPKALAEHPFWSPPHTER